MRPLEAFLKPTQEELFTAIRKLYKDKSGFFSKGNFILIQGEAPIMLVAHLDTVHEKSVKTICYSPDENILMSPQGIGGDDRCGVYALVNAYDMAVKKPFLLFTCDEEVGGVGAKKFCLAHQLGKLPDALDNLKLIVEVDRKGSCDAVYYDCYNPELRDYINSKGFKTAVGSFSDISLIAPELGIAAVNLSSGYYNAHTLHEYINRNHLDNTLSKVVEIISDASQDNFPKYEYASYDDYGYFREDEIIQSLPSEYKQIYYELLNIYSVDELENFRAEYGNKILFEIYADEFGDTEYDTHNN